MKHPAPFIIVMVIALLTVGGCAGRTAAQIPVSEALRRDAEAYAEAHDVPLDEAVWRLRAQDPVGELGAVLREREPQVFAGLWIEHEPGYRVVVLVTRGQRRIERRYIQGGPLADIAEVREAQWTLETLNAAQTETMRILSEIDSKTQTGLDTQGNCVALYAADPGAILTEIDAAGLTLPEPVCLVEIGPYPEPPPLNPPPGLVFPRQRPPEGLRAEMTALLIGELVEEDACLWVRDEFGRHLIIWPYDHTVTASDDGAIQIHDGSGEVVARVGDTVRLGGGEVPAIDEFTTTEIPDRCSGPYWLASSEITEAE